MVPARLVERSELRPHDASGDGRTSRPHTRPGLWIKPREEEWTSFSMGVTIAGSARGEQMRDSSATDVAERRYQIETTE